MFRFFIKQYLFSKSFILSVCLLYLFLLISALEDFASTSGAFQIVQVANVLGVAVLLRPLAAALPISMFLMREWGSHYYQCVLIRGNCLRYATNKTVSACIIGFLVPFAANLLLLLTVAVVSPSQYLLSKFDPGPYFPDFSLEGKLHLGLFLYITAFSVSGAVWAAVVTGISAFTTNAYVLIAAPFLLDRSVSYLLQLISLRAPFVLYFDTSNTYALRMSKGFLFQLLFVLLLVFVITTIVLARVKRRQRNG